jgi:hypothetical protein
MMPPHMLAILQSQRPSIAFTTRFHPAVYFYLRRLKNLLLRVLSPCTLLSLASSRADLSNRFKSVNSPLHAFSFILIGHTVRMAAIRDYSLGWVNYDEQYRLRKATSPSSSCGVVDMELWMLCVYLKCIIAYFLKFKQVNN